MRVAILLGMVFVIVVLTAGCGTLPTKDGTETVNPTVVSEILVTNATNSPTDGPVPTPISEEKLNEIIQASEDTLIANINSNTAVVDGEKESVESAYIVDADTGLKHWIRGDVSSTNISGFLQYMTDKEHGYIILHTHPYGSTYELCRSFSPGDLIVMSNLHRDGYRILKLYAVNQKNEYVIYPEETANWKSAEVTRNAFNDVFDNDFSCANLNDARMSQVAFHLNYTYQHRAL